MSYYARPECVLCGHAAHTRHHLIPMGYPGSTVGFGDVNAIVPLYHLCHATLHKKLTNTQLAEECGTLEKLKTHPVIVRMLESISSCGRKRRGESPADVTEIGG